MSEAVAVALIGSAATLLAAWIQNTQRQARSEAPPWEEARGYPAAAAVPVQLLSGDVGAWNA
jgi:hypothetical protein